MWDLNPSGIVSVVKISNISYFLFLVLQISSGISKWGGGVILPSPRHV